MNTMKQRKRLSIMALIFLLVFAAGAAFAFAPGRLDIVGRIAIESPSYVVWTLAHTSVDYRERETDEPLEFDEWENFEAAANPDTNPVVERDTLPARNMDANYTHDTYTGVRISEATITTGEFTGRTRQRITWDILFYGPGTARLYIEASNLSEVFEAYIDQVTVTTNDFSAASGVTLTDDDIESMFTIDGTFDQLASTTLLRNIVHDDVGSRMRSDVYYVDIEWDGSLPDDFDADEYGSTRNPESLEADGVVFIGTFTIEFEYELQTD